MNEQEDYSGQSSVFFRQCLVMDCVTSVYEINVLLVSVYISPMVMAYGLSKTASHSKEMSESWYVAEVSPVHKITFSEEFSSNLTIKSSLRPYGYTGCLKKSKSNGIANRLSNVFLTTFSSIVNVRAVPSDFSVPSRLFNPIQDGHFRSYSGMGGKKGPPP